MSYTNGEWKTLVRDEDDEKPIMWLGKEAARSDHVNEEAPVEVTR